MISGFEKGSVALVGGGPGDPGLITLRGLRCLQHADVVVYDQLVSTELLSSVPEGAELIYVGKQAGNHALPQDKINELLVEKAREGRFVVRLKGGDPFVFGRGGEEALRLVESEIPFRVVPGVTAAVSTAAYAGIPVTHRGRASAVALITGHPAAGSASAVDWQRVAASGIDTLAIYMGVRQLERIAGDLVRYGKPADTPAAVIASGTTPDQQTITGPLSEIGIRARQAGIKPPALFLVGSVAELHHQLNWFERLPLFGRTMVVLRPGEQCSDLAEPLTELGARVIRFPVIRLAKAMDERPLKRAVQRLADYQWILFTSPNGVRSFFRVLGENGYDSRAVSASRVGVIGPGTAQALVKHGICPDLVPDEAVAESLAEAMVAEMDAPGIRVLLPQAREGRPVLEERLRSAGAIVERVEAYRMIPDERHTGEELKSDLEQKRIDAVLFTSSSTVRSFTDRLALKTLADLLGKCELISIGPVTTKTITALGGSVALEAADHTIPGLVETIRNHYGNDDH